MHSIYYNLADYSRREFENTIINQKINIQLIFETPYKLQHQSAIKVFSWIVQVFYTSKWPTKDYHSLDDSIYDLLLDYNDKLHSTTKVSLYRVIMNANDYEFITKDEETIVI